MRVLGIDPGYAIIGWGVVDYNANRFSVVNFGAITTPAKTVFESRLLTIYEQMNEIIETTAPDCISIEKLYFNSNTTTAIEVAEARGVILLSARQHCIPVSEYTPLQVKQSVTGYGRAEKKQVMEMTGKILNLKKLPKPDDTADALALAICHSHSAGSIYGRLSLNGGLK